MRSTILPNTGRRSRRGLGRPEVVVLVLCGLALLALLPPLLLQQREAARATACANDLREIGRGLFAFAEQDEAGRLCTGAYDWQRDGCPTEYGWVADLVNVTAENPQSMRCPSNPVRGIETIADLLESKQGGTRLPPDLRERAMAGRCEQVAEDGDRVAFVETMLADGYGTNFVPSWYLVRSTIRTQANEQGELVTPEKWGLRDLGGSVGPLTLQDIEVSEVPAANLPLVGDAAASWTEDGSLPVAIRGVGEAGTPLGATMTGGPVYYNAKRQAFVSLLPGTVVVPKDLKDEAHRPFCLDAMPGFDRPGDPGMDGKLWLQDTRQWAAVHPHGLNLLMADGGVKTIADRNGDGYVNPGFDLVEPSKTYVDATLEVAPFEVYLGPCWPVFSKYTPKGVFE